MSREISRRTFIKGAAAAGVVLVAGSYFTWNGRNIPEKVQRGDVTYVASEECAIRVIEPEVDRIFSPAGGEAVVYTLKNGGRTE